MAIFKIGTHTPDVDASAYVTDSASVIGNVHLAANTSIWFGAALRGDNELISIGEGSNVQECAVLHTDIGYPLVVGKNVTIGHQTMLHGCTVGDGSLIGIQAIVLDGAVIGKNCLVAAGALVTSGKEFPDNSLIMGSPAKAVRELTQEQINDIQRGVTTYIERAAYFKQQLKRID
ncbi:MAG: gamma carbonic anhydrase family protein [Sulfuritalea sp.]|nr:gamma carbonic anhydrase family protein [Polynucleobacter sp.]MCF8188809.1 gamma carbonic anhydrase family protein [Sulfuritalea sp.]